MVWRDLPYEQYRAAYTQAAVAGQNGYIGLLNASQIGKVLSVLIFAVQGAAGFTANIRRLQSGAQTAKASSLPVYTGGGADPQGLLYSGTSATPPATFDQTATLTTGMGFGALRPLFVLPPGWALEIWHPTAVTAVSLWFQYQVDDDEVFTTDDDED